MTVSTIVKAAALAVASFAVAPAAFAQPKPVTISAATFATPESRLCMAAEPLGLKVDKGQPKVMCMVRSEWEAKGVTFKIK